MMAEAASLLSPLQLFLMLFPVDYIKQTILTQLNVHLFILIQMNKEHLVSSLFIWVFDFCFRPGRNATFVTTGQMKPLPCGQLHLGVLINTSLEESSMQLLRCFQNTDDPAPEFRDPYHRVQQMIQEWNDNMSRKFSTSWVNCLDESM